MVKGRALLAGCFLQCCAVVSASDQVPVDIKIALASGAYEEALPWLHQAAEARHSGAALTLGKMYRLGQVVPRDLERAKGYLLIASSGGEEAADRLLALWTVDAPAPVSEFVAHVDALGNTTLHKAVLEGNLTLLRSLAKSGSLVHQSNSEGATALHLAVARGNADMISTLLEWGADPAVPDARGWSALDLAARSTDLRVRAVLGLEDDRLRDQSPHRALLSGDVRALERVADTVLQQPGLLHLAVKEGSPEVVQALIDLGLDPDARDERGRTTLHLAAELGDLDVIALLVGAGAATNLLDANGRSALLLLAKAGARAPLPGIDSLPEDASRVLWWMARQGWVDGVEQFLDAGVTPMPSMHPAVAAAQSDHVDVCGLFDVSEEHPVTSDGNNLLMVAAHHGSLNVLRSLIARGIGLNTRGDDGDTALHLAVQAGRLEASRVLLAAGASVAVRNERGLSSRMLIESKEDSEWQSLLSSQHSDLRTALADLFD